MNKKHFSAFVAFSLLTLASCGGEKTEEKEKTGEPETVAAVTDPFAEKCNQETKLSMTITGYEFGLSGKYAYETPSFEVKESSWKMLNDSVAEMKLSNYAAADLVGERKDDQVDIMVKLSTRKHKGKTLEAGTYGYMEYDSPMFSMVTMQTSKGTVYFNWVSGMPEQGNVTIDYMDKERVCGNFALAVEKADNKQIGIVRLNGTFSIGEPVTK